MDSLEKTPAKVYRLQLALLQLFLCCSLPHHLLLLLTFLFEMNSHHCLDNTPVYHVRFLSIVNPLLVASL
jgi:hypothetical protein